MKNHTYVVAAAWLTGAIACKTAVFDLAADWSDVSNPNGAWSLLEASELLQFSDTSPIFSAPQPVWAGTGYLPVVLQVGALYDQILPSWATGDIMVHPNDNGSETILRWTSPDAGVADVSGGVWYAHEGEGRSGWWGLAINGTVVTDGVVFEGDSHDRDTPFDLAAGSAGAAVLQGI
jgi:hypothetical protein